nr:hypothetical protein [Tanacetum cinerariifolium]
MKKINRGITMINHTQAKAIRKLSNVLCQVGVTTIIAKFLILDIPIDHDAPIVVGRGFLYTMGSILNTPDRLFSTFDRVCHQTFRAIRFDVLRTAESDSDDEEEYVIKRNRSGAPIYGLKPAPYLNWLKASWKHSPKKPIIYHCGHEMDFRSFMMEEVDGDINFLLGEGSSPSTNNTDDAPSNQDDVDVVDHSRQKAQKKKWVNYEKTLSILYVKHNRVVVVQKVVPDMATKLIRSDEMGLLVTKLVKAAIFHGRRTAFEEMSGYRSSSKEEFN